MSENKGKQFETIIHKSFESVTNTSVVRLHDQTTGYLGSSNHCDFIVYHKPYEYHIECKSIHGNTLSIHGTDEKHKYGNITNKQYEGLLEKSKIPGIISGIICWYIDKDVTLFIPINTIKIWKEQTTMKSIPSNIYEKDLDVILLKGKKKRVFWEYDMKDFFNKTFDIK